MEFVAMVSTSLQVALYTPWYILTPRHLKDHPGWITRSVGPVWDDVLKPLPAIVRFLSFPNCFGWTACKTLVWIIFCLVLEICCAAWAKDTFCLNRGFCRLWLYKDRVQLRNVNGWHLAPAKMCCRISAINFWNIEFESALEYFYCM